MKIETTPLPDLLVLTPRRFTDARGFFAECWNRRTFEAAGLLLPEFVQDNHSLSHAVGTLRGMHFQAPPHAQGKMVRCGRGRMFDVAVDIRRGSPAYGQWFGVEIDADTGRQVWLPPGFMHGFVTLKPDTEVIYKCTDYYAPDCDRAVRWDSLGIDWGVSAPLLSDKDAVAPRFADFESPFDYRPAD